MLASLGRTWSAHARETLASYREVPRAARGDLAAGLSVACVAIPLNLALALACGLPAVAGVVAGGAAGLVAGLLGSARLQITGPEIALAPIGFAIVQRHGLQGLAAATALAGLLQIVFALSGAARVLSAVPKPVVSGFMAAIGLLVLNAQTPRLLGLASEVRSLGDLVAQPRVLAGASLAAIVVGAIVVATMLLLPRASRKLPAPLVALAIVLVACAWLQPSVPMVGALPVGSIAPRLPSFAGLDLAALLPQAVALAIVASLDSLLSASAIDTISGKDRHRSDHELAAQGVANLVSSVFGGMPVAGAIVRSSAALAAGAQSRLAPISQSVVLLALAFVGSRWTASLPISALAAVLLVVGVRLIDVRALVRIARVSRFEAFVFVATAVAIVCTDFLKGVLLGSILALLRFLGRPWQLSIEAHEVPARDDLAIVEVLSLSGPLFFGSHVAVQELATKETDASATLLDLSAVTAIDCTGAAALEKLVAVRCERGRVAIVARGAIEQALVRAAAIDPAASLHDTRASALAALDGDRLAAGELPLATTAAAA